MQQKEVKMSKIYKLFIDENIKTWKKFSTKVMIILTILALVGSLALTKWMEFEEKKSVSTNDINWREYAESEIEINKIILEDENLSQEEREEYQTEIKRYELCLKYDINMYDTSWKYEALNKALVGTEINEKVTDVLEKDDFQGYIQLQKEWEKEALDKNEISQQKYDDDMLILDLYSEYEIGKLPNDIDDGVWKEKMCNDIELAQLSLRNGIDINTNKVLSLEKKQQYEDEIKMAIYRIENNIPSSDAGYTDGDYRMMFENLAPSFVTVVIAIFAIIIAGTSIAKEVSTGTIKFWALTPNKRWKILTAKILSVLFYIITIALIMSLLTVAFSNLFFQGQRGNQYIYVKDGNVEIIRNTLFMIEYYLVNTIPVMIFSVFALMLSVITRNSEFALGISIAIYMVNSIAMQVLNAFVKKDWFRYIPFNNLNIADKIFPNFEKLFITWETTTISTSLGFSLVVLAVCTILMLVTAYDSFNNRDII